MESDPNTYLGTRDIAVKQEEDSQNAYEKNPPITEQLPEEEEEEAEQIQYPKGFKLVTLTIALMLSTFIVALDTNVIGTAIPKIATQFNSLKDIGWYGSAYLLTLMALQPLYGKIYTYFNIKLIFISSLIIFEIGSTVCATASNSKIFIIGRAISGSGAAGLMPGALAIGNFLVPLQKRSIYMSIVMSVYGIASVGGPMLGGVLTDSEKLTWRWCFWLNLPIGAVALLVYTILLDPYKTPRGLGLSMKSKFAQMDFVGCILSASAILCLLLGLNWGGIEYSWNSPRVLGVLISSGLLLAFFVFMQIRLKERATIPPRIFTQRTVFFGCVFTCFLNMAIDTHIYYLPLYFQSVQGVAASSSGVRLLPYLATMIATAVISGTCVSIFKIYVPFMVIGAAIMTVGSGLIHTLGRVSHPSPAQWIGYQLLTGIGFGMSFQLPYSALPVVLDAKDLPIGNALLIFFQAFGGAVAVSVAQNILNHSLLERLQSMSDIIRDPSAVIAAGATRIPSAVAPELVYLVRDAYRYALSQTFILPIGGASLAFCYSWWMEWRRIPIKSVSSS